MRRNEVKPKYLIWYLCLFLMACTLTFIRWLSYLHPGTKILPDFILLHITNFSLSLMLMLAFGFTVLVFGGKMIVVRLAGLLIIAFNLIYEVLFPILNTPDIVDALFGLCGVIIAFAFLYMLNKKGFMKK